jgi:hypothetical protein
MQTLGDLRNLVDQYAEDCWDERLAAGDLHYVADKIVRYPTQPTLFEQQSVLVTTPLFENRGFPDYA